MAVDSVLELDIDSNCQRKFVVVSDMDCSPQVVMQDGRLPSFLDEWKGLSCRRVDIKPVHDVRWPKWLRWMFGSGSTTWEVMATYGTIRNHGPVEVHE